MGERTGIMSDTSITTPNYDVDLKTDIRYKWTSYVEQNALFTGVNKRRGEHNYIGMCTYVIRYFGAPTLQIETPYNENTETPRSYVLYSINERNDHPYFFVRVFNWSSIYACYMKHKHPYNWSVVESLEKVQYLGNKEEAEVYCAERVSNYHNRLRILGNVSLNTQNSLYFYFRCRNYIASREWSFI